MKVSRFGLESKYLSACLVVRFPTGLVPSYRLDLKAVLIRPKNLILSSSPLPITSRKTSEVLETGATFQNRFLETKGRRKQNA